MPRYICARVFYNRKYAVNVQFIVNTRIYLNLNTIATYILQYRIYSTYSSVYSKYNLFEFIYYSYMYFQDNIYRIYSSL